MSVIKNVVLGAAIMAVILFATHPNHGFAFPDSHPSVAVRMVK